MLQAEALVSLGHSVTVVCGKTTGTHSGMLRGVRVIRLACFRRRPFTRLTYHAQLFRFVLANARRFDVIHVHLAFLQADTVGLAAFIRGVPTYVKVASGGQHGELAHGRKVARIFRWFGLRHAARVQALSEEIELELNELGVDNSRIVRIPNGIALKETGVTTGQARNDCRLALELPIDPTVILYAGRFEPTKGVIDLIRVWQQLAPSLPNAILVMVGGGSVDPHHYGPTPRLFVRPWQSDPNAYFVAADFVVHPSHFDGMPNVVLEAFATSRPVAASKHGGTADLLQDDVNSLVFPPGDLAKLSQIIRRLTEDAGLRDRLAEAGRATAEFLEVHKIARLIEAEYRKVVADIPNRAP
jgi:glycosyltransferase involved in cell wall biosynthesis